jgi:pyruvate formate lyase activating enzyme
MDAAREKLKTLRSKLLEHTREGELWASEPNGAIRCYACGHRCPIPEGRDGVCKVRSNVGGKLLVPWGYVAGLQCDPIEKKPFFHIAPGTRALSFGMLGCDLHCAYCQNWVTSQSLRDPAASVRTEAVTPEILCDYAGQLGAQVMTSTYNEPLITSEWAVEIFKVAKARGLRNSYVSNGNATPEVLEYLRPYVDFYKIDLKSFDEKHYRELGAVLGNVLDSIRRVYAMGFWVELVTLLIPGFNDGDDELKAMCEFIASVSPDIPWHATAFHKDYKMMAPDDTSVETLYRAAEIARSAGLNFIYLGNAPGRVGDWENTRCPSCRETLVVRRGFQVLRNVMTGPDCPKCHRRVPGVWTLA